MISKYTYNSNNLLFKLTIVYEEDELIEININDDYNGFSECEACLWLDRYFAGELVNNDEIKIKLNGTEFQKLVWNEIKQIPYGKVISYKEIGDRIAKKTGKRVSYQAVGQAVGRNPIPFIIPCHRVIGSDGSLTGFSLGLDLKKRLLALERKTINNLHSKQ